jgi:hypothetical protein
VSGGALGRFHHRVTPGSAEQGGDPGAELARTEGLGQVVVSTGLKPKQRIRFARQCADHDHVGVAEGTDPARGLDAVKVGEPCLQGDQDGVVLPHGSHTFGAGRRCNNLESGLDKQLLQSLPAATVAVNHHSHAARNHQNPSEILVHIQL